MPKVKHSNRDFRICLRLTERECKLICDQAKSLDISVSQLIRDCTISTIQQMKGYK
jgi:hypothetical protein